jgi:hypothetical protein
MCCTRVESDLSVSWFLVSVFIRCQRKQKKAGVVEHPEVFHHAGLLANEPPGHAGLLFISSSDDIRSIFGGSYLLAHTGYPFNFHYPIRSANSKGIVAISHMTIPRSNRAESDDRDRPPG